MAQATAPLFDSTRSRHHNKMRNSLMCGALGYAAAVDLCTSHRRTTKANALALCQASHALPST